MANKKGVKTQGQFEAWQPTFAEKRLFVQRRREVRQLADAAMRDQKNTNRRKGADQFGQVCVEEVELPEPDGRTLYD